MRIESDLKLDFSDVLIRPKRSSLTSRKDVNLLRTFTFKHSRKVWHGIPIMAANMDTTGTFEMAKAFSKSRMLVALHKHYSEAEIVEFYERHDEEFLSHVFYSLGLVESDYKKLRAVKKAVGEKLWAICIDVANGYTEVFSSYVQKIRKEFPDLTIMAGNVVTGEMVEALVLAGADIVKVGIGPGSVCTTRKMTGVGYPQLSAIIECADAAHGLGALICSDGGLQVPGDVPKAFGGGADFVMSGSFFAAHDESGGDLLERDGKFYKLYYGMSSDTAMNKHSGGVADYRASEGKTVLVPYRGPVSDTIKEILGGLRSACTYAGAARLKDLSKCTTFIRVYRQLNNFYTGSEVKN
ncbi:GMP reductase [Candidatus Woesearchaeota archaeon]|nr:GMP reductase [Candidatus Woesearchaeota archaeon]